MTLSADLYCPSGDGIVLAANVTLDLGGHRLVGPGSSGIGIQTLEDSSGGVTIRNGEVKNWEKGIYLNNSTAGAASSTISRVVLRMAPVSNDFGNGTLRLTRVTAVHSAISGVLGGNVAVSHSTLTRSSVGVFGANATITRSTLIESYLSSSYYGEILVDASKLDGKGKGSLGDVSETSMTIRNSTVTRFKSPISGWWGAVTLKNSKFSDMPNGVLGSIAAYPGTGGPAIIRGNFFTRSGVALRGNVPMIVENNRFIKNSTPVLFTMPAPFPEDPPLTAGGSRAVGNILANNSGTGIKTELPGLAVGSNAAKNNGEYGIYAPGAIDLGRNTARGNKLGQCVGVSCTAR